MGPCLVLDTGAEIIYLSLSSVILVCPSRKINRETGKRERRLGQGEGEGNMQFVMYLI